MRAVLKDIYSPDTDDLILYQPPIHDNFSILVTALVGTYDKEGMDSVDIEVCTPLWMLSLLEKEDAVLGRGYLLVKEYDYPKIYEKIKRLVESCGGDHWPQIGEKLSRIGYWEFEDYRDL
ncbi:MAG: hypothetical protein BGO14_01020 [Chlamydiales bacterium 38-26]|mgnify:FL=1|nr:immunity 8 family protein [Chlamydiales bacterium]OJV07301.1 MAG: hypothetical protein BGO14_01020 [Chlamydiales bacterium 38-26]